MNNCESLLLIGLLFSSSCVNSTELDQLTGLDNFYDNLHVCSVAKVRSWEHSDNGLNVNLFVEEKTANALKNMAKHDRNNWMALHCPPEYPYFYNTESIVDVTIYAQSESTSITHLSCKQFYINQHIQVQEKIANKLEQLNHRLSKLKN